MKYDITGHSRLGFTPVLTLLALLILALAVLFLLAIRSPAQAAVGSIVAQQSPYGPPQTEIDLLPGAVLFANFPLWAQAASVSAFAVSAFFFVVPVARRIWGTFAGPDGDGS